MCRPYVGSKAFSGRGTKVFCGPDLQIAEVRDIRIGAETTMEANFIPDDPAQLSILRAIVGGFSVPISILLVTGDSMSFGDVEVSGEVRIDAGSEPANLSIRFKTGNVNFTMAVQAKVGAPVRSRVSVVDVTSDVNTSRMYEDAPPAETLFPRAEDSKDRAL